MIQYKFVQSTSGSENGLQCTQKKIETGLQYQIRENKIQTGKPAS